jgi:hypothetical protein
MVLSASCLVLAAMALPLAIQSSAALAPRLLAGALLPSGAALALLARSMRKKARGSSKAPRL